MSREKVCIILLLSCILVIMTPLNAYSGYIMAFGLFICALFSFGKIHVEKDIIQYCLFFLLSYVLYVIFYPNKYFDVYFNNAIIMFLTAICLLPIMKFYIKSEKRQTYKLLQIDLIDCIYFILLSYSLFEVFYFGVSNTNVWDRRMQLQYQTFPFAYHHVDFSVIVMFIFLLGIKRNYYITSSILAIASIIILPSRTMKLFFLLFIMCAILKKRINAIMHKWIFNSYFKLFLWLILGVVFISYIWLFVLCDFFSVVDGHEGLYDTSNFERFQTVLYAIFVIVKKGLILHGLDTNVEYSTLVEFEDWMINLGPHNSFISILLFYSVFFGGMYLFMFSKMIDAVNSEELVQFILPYLLCGCVLHDMFIGIRALMFLIVLFVPFRTEQRRIKIYNNIIT